ncbi:MAG: nucleotidyltransferase domain-containing protein [Patescibacteria group bacterium]|nr:nucleotidyltransferase domain-containing protein [Patescibacteria group bacterium]
MTWQIRDSIIATLAYSHIFNYPLAIDELNYWLITDSSEKLQKTTMKDIPDVYTYQNYYGLLSEKLLKRHVNKRKKRKILSEQKYEIAKKIAKVLEKIPTILLVGVSGGLAMNNADKDDDIDFFVITLPNTVWITRFMILCVLELIGRRRKVGVQNVADTICVNMLIDSHHLALPIEERDVYSAHEVLQMVPIVQKGDIYGQFLQANSWIRNYLYNAWIEKQKNTKFQRNDNKKNLNLLYFLSCLLYIPEFFIKYFQLWYMRERRTTEKISHGVIRFHPKDMRIFISERYLKILKQYNIPLDRRFFQSLK